MEWSSFPRSNKTLYCGPISTTALPKRTLHHPHERTASPRLKILRLLSTDYEQSAIHCLKIINGFSVLGTTLPLPLVISRRRWERPTRPLDNRFTEIPRNC